MNDDILDVGEWIQYAEDDYDAAVTIAKTNNPYAPRKVCYDCHQSAEKMLKAYMIAKEGTRIKIHDLGILLDGCKRYASDFGVLDAACLQLNMYITETRYPSGTKLTKSDMSEALDHALKILEFTRAKLKALGYEYVSEQAR